MFTQLRLKREILIDGGRQIVWLVVCRRHHYQLMPSVNKTSECQRLASVNERRRHLKWLAMFFFRPLCQKCYQLKCCGLRDSNQKEMLEQCLSVCLPVPYSFNSLSDIPKSNTGCIQFFIITTRQLVQLLLLLSFAWLDPDKYCLLFFLILSGGVSSFYCFMLPRLNANSYIVIFFRPPEEQMRLCNMTCLF